MPGDLLENDLFQFDVPLMKSMTVDENGDVFIEGIASVPQQDHQGETLDPRGFELNYFEKSGWIKWEHKGANNGPASPAQFIGEPVEARITPEGQFYLKARLYRDSPYVQEVKEQLELLEKSQSSRKMGFSIEGQALKRNPLNPLKVAKAIIRNVVLTMNPVNDGSWAVLCKSLTGADALSVDLDEGFSLEKAMDTAAAAAIMPQSLEGTKPKDEDDDTVKALTAYRSYVRKLSNKELNKSLLDVNAYGIVTAAYDHATDHGLAHSEALEFGSLVYEKRALLKSVPLLLEQGGAGMSKLANILGESVDELEKSLNPQAETQTDEDQELDELIKSLEADEDEDEDQAGKTGEAQAGETGEDEGDEMEKSMDVDLTKSMGTDALEAIDVSEFLNDLVKSVNGTLNDFSEDQALLGKGIAVIARSLQASTELIKSLQAQVEELGATPRGRRSAVAPKDVVTAPARTGGTIAPSDELQKSQVMDLLRTAVYSDKVALTKLTAFEMGYPIDTGTAQVIGVDAQKNPRWVQG